jgi:hypothetical protein
MVGGSWLGDHKIHPPQGRGNGKSRIKKSLCQRKEGKTGRGRGYKRGENTPTIDDPHTFGKNK